MTVHLPKLIELYTLKSECILSKLCLNIFNVLEYLSLSQLSTKISRETALPTSLQSLQRRGDAAHSFQLIRRASFQVGTYSILAEFIILHLTILWNGIQMTNLWVFPALLPVK